MVEIFAIMQVEPHDGVKPCSVKDTGNVKEANEETDFRCGWLCFTPNCLQRFASALCVCLCLTVGNTFISGTYNGLSGSAQVQHRNALRINFRTELLDRDVIRHLEHLDGSCAYLPVFEADESQAALDRDGTHRGGGRLRRVHPPALH